MNDLTIYDPCLLHFRVLSRPALRALQDCFRSIRFLYGLYVPSISSRISLLSSVRVAKCKLCV